MKKFYVNDVNELNEKLYFFKDNNIKVHVDLKDGTFLNGFVVGCPKENVWIIKEDKLGEVFLFVKDVIKLREFWGESMKKGGEN